MRAVQNKHRPADGGDHRLAVLLIQPQHVARFVHLDLADVPVDHLLHNALLLVILSVSELLVHYLDGNALREPIVDALLGLGLGQALLVPLFVHADLFERAQPRLLGGGAVRGAAERAPRAVGRKGN